MFLNHHFTVFFYLFLLASHSNMQCVFFIISTKHLNLAFISTNIKIIHIFLQSVSNKIIQIPEIIVYLCCLLFLKSLIYVCFLHVYHILLFAKYSVWKINLMHNLRTKVWFLFSVVSHQRALAAQDQGWISVSVPQITKSYFQSMSANFTRVSLIGSSWIYFMSFQPVNLQKEQLHLYCDQGS